jgi:hypothetical protein
MRSLPGRKGRTADGNTVLGVLGGRRIRRERPRSSMERKSASRSSSSGRARGVARARRQCLLLVGRRGRRLPSPSIVLGKSVRRHRQEKDVRQSGSGRRARAAASSSSYLVAVFAAATARLSETAVEFSFCWFQALIGLPHTLCCQANTENWLPATLTPFRHPLKLNLKAA